MNDNLSRIVASGAAFARFTAHEAMVIRVHARMVAMDPRALAWGTLREDERLCVVRDAGAVPGACGDAAPVAPARGPVRVFDFMGSYPATDGGSVLKPAGFGGRRSLQCVDVFDRMRVQAARRGAGSLLTDSHVGMGRIYGGLLRDRDAGAIRCVSLEASSGGGGGSREGFTDHRLALSRRIDLLQGRAAAGDGLVVRRSGARARGNIPARVIVDAVCWHDQDISAVLARHGWCVKGDTVRAATAVLAAALDRMIGPVRGGIVGATFGDGCVPMMDENRGLTA
jgi:hypothetical protein